MRFIVYGVGAIGGVIVGQLSRAGYDVLAIARGQHHDAIRDDGLRVTTPDGDYRVSPAVYAIPDAIDFADDDVVIMAMKSQDTEQAIQTLCRVAPRRLPVACAQNGVANERAALRRFPNVYGIAVMLPATHLTAGTVAAHSSPTPGILDVGRVPGGIDDVAELLAVVFRKAGFVSEPRQDIMRWKYRKLIVNLGNAVDALCGSRALGGQLFDMAVEEGRRCLDAAGIDYASKDEDEGRRGTILRVQDAEGQARRGNSSWQSLARGTNSVETDFLTGEIVLLGRLHGFPTPVNSMLQAAIQATIREETPPGSVAESSLLERLATATN